MDKSESELLADWDVVSSVYDTEQEKEASDKKSDVNESSSNTKNGNVDDSENQTESSVKNSEAAKEEIIAVDADKAIEQTVKSDSASEQVNEGDAASEQNSEADISAEEVSELDTVIERIAEADDAVIDQNLEVDEIVEQVAEVETESKEINVQIEANIACDGEKACEVTTKESSNVDNERTEEKIEKIVETSVKQGDDDRSKCVTNIDAVPDHTTEVSTECNAADSSDDRAANSSLDSSMENIQIEYCGGSRVQETPELIDLVEQENAAIESSSSDIDIIDENMEESITSSFVHPLSLSITSSVDTSSLMTTPSEGNKEIKTEKESEDINIPVKVESPAETPEIRHRTVDSHSEKPQPSTTDSFSTKSESFSKQSESFKKSTYVEEEENIRSRSQRPPPRQAASGIFAVILEFLRNMTRFEWSILGGVVICLYVTIVFNQTNIFAVVERENVVSQMKSMMDELKNDNKILKDQMLSEMKNEKVFSSFEHQIKELKKENSKLNHMLYDVVKVLEEQKDSQEKFKKRESDYIAPFKKEINKLKEHINILKFDNEELQKQLVRMRYASYSQGGGTSDEKAKEQKEETKPPADESSSAEEISLDINSLKKWNELVTLLTKELGILSENDPVTEKKSNSDFNNNISWYWKVFLKEFKGTFKDFKENVTTFISDYKQANEKAVTEIYKFVKDFFTVEENNFTPPDADSSQWKNIGDFVNDLKEKWTNIKERIYTSDLKNFMKNFRKSGEADTANDFYHSEKTESPMHESFDRKPTNIHFESERKPTNFPSESERKHDGVQTDSEDTKWMFKRAELRAELRDSEEEDPSENWFLKKKKHVSDDDERRIKY